MNGRAIAAALVAAAILVPAHLKAPFPVLMAERIVPGGGWAEIALLALYAGWLTGRLADPARAPRVRRWLWTGFSVVFFAQLLAGLAGAEVCLMSGDLHPPVPALIVAAPLYRGARYFMPILLGVTLLLVGPAWCSHLCYLGAWDNLAADRVRRPVEPPRWAFALRWATLGLALAVPLAMRAAGLGPIAAGWVAGAFGVVGVGVMLAVSRRLGWMAHCLAWCPIGLLACLLGRVSPFRLRMTPEACTGCLRCVRSCRYGALTRERIERRAVGGSCTLCGDCLAHCPHEALSLRWLRLSPERARGLFLVLICALHAAFLGVART